MNSHESIKEQLEPAVYLDGRAGTLKGIPVDILYILH